MIVSDGWEAPTGKKLYAPTDKEPPAFGSHDEEYAYWVLVGHIRDKFGDEGATTKDIYYGVTRTLGLSSSETIALVRRAKAAGYLK